MSSFYTPSDEDIPLHLPKMKSLYKDLFHGGKNYRGTLVQLISDDLKLPQKSTETLARSVEFIHNSSLLHDDVVDNAALRRGKTTAWKKYGAGYAILGGDYLLARVIKDLCQFNSIKLVEFTSDTILSLVEGEWLQDECHNKTDLTSEKMSEVHRLKTGALFSWCFKAPMMLKDQNSKTLQLLAVEIGELFGALLQRSDDLLDFNIRNFEDKAYFKDLPSGYFNLFAVELLEDVKEEKKEKAFEIKELAEFLGHFKINLDEKLKSFDSESEKLIVQLNSKIDQMSVFSEEFKTELKNLASTVYWRK